MCVVQMCKFPGSLHICSILSENCPQTSFWGKLFNASVKFGEKFAFADGVIKVLLTYSDSLARF